MKLDFEMLDFNGFIEITGQSVDEILDDIQCKFKSSVFIENILTPNKITNRYTLTLSKVFKDAEFPFHTDGAMFNVPPKFIILENLSSVDTYTDTILHNLNYIISNNELMKEINRILFRVSNGPKTFLSSFFTEKKFDVRFCRLNPLILHPFDNKFCINNYLNHSLNHYIHWDIGKIVIIKNWMCLHARSAVNIEDLINRKLRRISIFI